MFGFSSVICLALATVVAGQSAVPSPSDYLVTGLTKFGLQDETYAGFMPLNFDQNDEGSLFFWLASRRINATATEQPPEKLVVWLNGGPGCSSMVGMMWENGPFTIHFGNEAPEGTTPEDFYLKYNPYSWNAAAHVLFVEQPVRTGFSIAAQNANVIETEFQVSEDFRNFLLSFITVFPQFRGMETFIAGESYAGFYIPYIAQHIVSAQLVEDSDEDTVASTPVEGHSTGETDDKFIGNIPSDDKPQTGAHSGRLQKSAKKNYNARRTTTTPTTTTLDSRHGNTRGGSHSHDDSHNSHDRDAAKSRDYKNKKDDNKNTKGKSREYVHEGEVDTPETHNSFLAAHPSRLNKKLSATGPTFHRDVTIDGINLVGAAIGNGVMDYFIQEPSYAEYAYNHGLIPLVAKQRFDYDWEVCTALVTSTTTPESITVGAFSECDMIDRVKEAAGQPNEYNTATFNAYPIIAPGGAFPAFFQDPYVQEALHVRGNNLPGINFIPEQVQVPPPTDDYNASNGANDDSPDKSKITADGLNGTFYAPPNGWQVCSPILDKTMLADRPVSAVSTIQFLVNNDYLRVLLYNGEFDLNCNFLGVLHTLEANEWRGRPWSHAARSLWRTGGDVAAEYFNFENMLGFLIVRNSGHLLPMDIPATALQMITNFMHDVSFSTIVLPSEYTYANRVAGVEGSISLTAEQAQSRDEVMFITFFVLLALGLMTLIVYYAYQKRSNSVNKYVPIGSTESYAKVPFFPIVHSENSSSEGQQHANIVEFRTFKTQQQPFVGKSKHNVVREIGV